VVKLYGAARYFLCRHFYRLSYTSQREDRYDRGLRQANKIRARLGGEPGAESPLPRRPKGMHERTDVRLRSQILSADRAPLLALAACLPTSQPGSGLGNPLTSQTVLLPWSARYPRPAL
jgi:hypothetical protein